MNPATLCIKTDDIRPAKKIVFAFYTAGIPQTIVSLYNSGLLKTTSLKNLIFGALSEKLKLR
jgi:hypothetical protein